jgi:hypothetical protein
MSLLRIAVPGPSTRAQVAPPSRLRHAPPSSTPYHTLRLSLGSTQIVSRRGRLTPEQNSGNTGAVGVQLMPASVDL